MSLICVSNENGQVSKGVYTYQKLQITIFPIIKGNRDENLFRLQVYTTSYSA